MVRLRARVSAVAGDLVGDTAPMRHLGERIARVAASTVPVLVLGETGVGKELVARAIHDAGPRASRPFVAENCGAFAEGVLESELFGHEAGAFTGAGGRRRGLFEQANGGTLFLDEVAEMTPAVQVRLLRALQEGIVRRVGGEAPVRVDARVIAATNRDLRELVAKGSFRQDLYYRLHGATLHVPPLRERRGDIERLVGHFLRAEGRAELTLSRAAWKALHAYGWPGNVRELQAEVRRFTVFCDGVVGLQDLAPEIVAAPASPAAAPRAEPREPRTLADAVGAAERDAIVEALARHGGNLSATARALRIDRNTLKRKLDLHAMR